MRNLGVLFVVVFPLTMIFGSAIFLQGAATVPQVYALSALPGDASLALANVIFDAPLTGSRDGNGRMHIGVAAAVPIEWGTGLVSVMSEGAPTQVLIDTGSVMHLVAAPGGPGPCEGSADVAFDGADYFYACRPNAAHDGFVWKQYPQPLVENWVPAVPAQ